MNLPMAVMSSFTLQNDPRRMAWRVMMPKNTSTRLSHEPEVVVTEVVSLSFPEVPCAAR